MPDTNLGYNAHSVKLLYFAFFINFVGYNQPTIADCLHFYEKYGKENLEEAIQDLYVKVKLAVNNPHALTKDLPFPFSSPKHRVRR